jgi:hypothetical protein
VHIAGKLDSRIAHTLLFNRLYVSCGLGVISSRYHQSHVRQLSRHDLERINHQFQPFVRSPLAKCQYSVLGIAPLREIRIFGPLR